MAALDEPGNQLALALVAHALMKERWSGLRMVICSADVQLVERYKSLGANAITKPTPMDDLQRLIMDIVSRQACAQPSGERNEYAHS